MSVVGIDYGNKTTKLCSFYNGVFKNLNSETDNRILQSLVVFDNNIRYFSDFAKSKENRCINQIVYNIKDKIHDDEYQSHLILNGTQHIINGFKLAFMFVTYIHKYIRTKINPDLYVHSYPDHYTSDELINYKNILETNKKYSDISYLLIPESIAVSLDYSLYRIANNEFVNRKVVLFINVGCTNISFYITEFFNNSIKVNFRWSLENCGSIHLDKLLLQYLFDNFKSTLSDKNINIDDKILEQKIIKRLYIECENIRKNINVSKEFNIYIESLYRDYNVEYKLTRDKYKSIIKTVIDKFYSTLEIINKNFSFNNIEFVGGFSRFFIFKEIASHFFKKINTSLNLDESISKGCCTYGAVFLPNYKKIDINIQYKYSSSIVIIINGSPIDLINNECYLPYVIRKALPKINARIDIKMGDNILYRGIIDENDINMSMKIGLDRIPSVFVEYIKNNKMKIRQIDIFNINIDNTLLTMEEELSKRDKEHVDKINLINEIEEIIFNNKNIKNNQNNKSNKNKRIIKSLDDVLAWVDEKSSTASLDELKKKYNLISKIIERD
jgi:hypothetical protein